MHFREWVASAAHFFVSEADRTYRQMCGQPPSVPYLLGFCFAANTGAAGTIIGTPQNTAAQKLGLSFAGVTEITAKPALLSLPIIWGVVSWLYRGRWQPARAHDQKPIEDDPTTCPFSRGETVKAVLVALWSSWPLSLVRGRARRSRSLLLASCR